MEKCKNESDKQPHNFREVIQFYIIDCETSLGKIVDILIILLNLFVVAIFIIQTYDFSTNTLKFLSVIEDVVVSFFVIEYIARLYGARNRIRHIFNIYSIIDFISILPLFLEPFIGHEHLGMLILFRMFRVFRILRFIRFFETTDFFFGRISKSMLKVLRLAMTVFMIFFISAGLIYLVESSTNDGIDNFGDAFYFVVVTLTTVGFGDIIPESGAGRAVITLCILSGISLIPWQVAEIAREWMHISHHKTDITCENCGLVFHDHDAVYCKACGKLIYQEFESD
ncbi:ion transporter [candidate division KSB1 bacterium]